MKIDALANLRLLCQHAGAHAGHRNHDSSNAADRTGRDGSIAYDHPQAADACAAGSHERNEERCVPASAFVADVYMWIVRPETGKNESVPS
jgi:hypothetical protein